MGLSNFIAARYYRSKSNWNIVNIISGSASFVLMVAICSFFIVLSVFSGLKNFGTNYSKAFDPDIKVFSIISKHFALNDSILKKLKSAKGVSFVSKIIEEKVLVQNNENNDFAYLHGIDQDYNSVVDIDSVVGMGKWISPFSKNLEAVVSFDLADKLNLGLFNYGGGLKILVPSKKTNNNIFKKPFSSSLYMVSGVFNSSDISDQKIIFTSIESARNLLKLKKEDVSALAIKIEKGYKPSSLAVKIKEILGENYSVKKRDELNETYYKMLNAEGLILNLVLGLILIVAMFNTVGAVIILIIEKQKNIKMFYKLGATKRQVNSVFFKHGLLLSYSGGFVGLALGCLIVFLQQSFGIILLTGTSIPYPVAFEFNNFLVVSTWLLAVGAGGSFLSSLALKKIKQ